MAVFEDRFRVKATLEAVSFFHKDTRTLQRLTPPPVIVQIRHIEPLAEGSKSAFTLWFGPLPVRWLAVHSHVDPRSGFTDTQAQGPMKQWIHTHHWQASEAGMTVTDMVEHVVYEHHPGLRGLLSQLLFAPPLLKFMFAYRRRVIRRSLET